MVGVAGGVDEGGIAPAGLLALTDCDGTEDLGGEAVVAGQLALKSSRAREGIEHLMAGYIDPGYEGRLTLELVNARVLHPVPLWPGMRIPQIVFHKMSLLPNNDYSVTGRYQGDQTLTEDAEHRGNNQTGN